jgi:thiosulfate/3-mercaptopyruvate sulfurtransferase
MKLSVMPAIAIACLAMTSLSAFAIGPLTSPAELKARLGEENLVILDIRSRIEVDDTDKTLAGRRDFSKGHIPGSVHADYTNAGWRDDQGLMKAMLPAPETFEALARSLGIDNEDTVVIVAGGTGSKALDLGSATRVYWSFKAMGHDEVTLLDGGYDAWVAAGYAVTTEILPPGKGNFRAELQPEMLVNGAMVELAMDSPTKLIDARPEAQFLARAQAGSARNPGTIPTAVSVPAPSLLGEGGAGFAALDTLRTRFAAIGFEDGDQGYAFCNTGHFASVTWFVGHELLGHDIQLYDGSMYDWTNVRQGPTVIGRLPEN